ARKSEYRRALRVSRKFPRRHFLRTRNRRCEAFPAERLSAARYRSHRTHRATDSVGTRASTATAAAPGPANRTPIATNAAAIAQSHLSREGQSAGRSTTFRSCAAVKSNTHETVAPTARQAGRSAARGRPETSIRPRCNPAPASNWGRRDWYEGIRREPVEAHRRRVSADSGRSIGAVGQDSSAKMEISDLLRCRSIRPADNGRTARRRGLARRSRPARAAHAADVRPLRPPAVRSDFRVDWNNEGESSRHNYGSRIRF